MQITVDDTMYASKTLIESCVSATFIEMGFKIMYGNTVVQTEPIKTEDYETGLLWWKKIYHIWHYQKVLQYEVKQHDVGEYTLILNVDFDDDWSGFIEKLNIKLGRVQNHLIIQFVRHPTFQPERQDNNPRDYFFY